MPGNSPYEDIFFTILENSDLTPEEKYVVILMVRKEINDGNTALSLKEQTSLTESKQFIDGANRFFSINPAERKHLLASSNTKLNLQLTEEQLLQQKTLAETKHQLTEFLHNVRSQLVNDDFEWENLLLNYDFLIHAIKYDVLPLIKMIIEYIDKANPAFRNIIFETNAQNYNAIQLAAGKNNAEILGLLLFTIAPEEDQPRAINDALHSALACGHLDLAKALIDSNHSHISTPYYGSVLHAMAAGYYSLDEGFDNQLIKNPAKIKEVMNYLAQCEIVEKSINCTVSGPTKQTPLSLLEQTNLPISYKDALRAGFKQHGAISTQEQKMKLTSPTLYFHLKQEQREDETITETQHRLFPPKNTR